MSLQNLLLLFCFLIHAIGTTPIDINPPTIAGSTLPEFKLPALLSSSAVKELQQLLYISNLKAKLLEFGVSKFSSWDSSSLSQKGDVVSSLRRIAAQESMHIQILEKVLTDHNEDLVPACSYYFPGSTIQEFLNLTLVVTTIGTSAMVGAASRLAETDPLLLHTLSSIVTVEARHDSALRFISNQATLTPVSFETRLSATWSYNLLQGLVRPGTCKFEIPQPVSPKLQLSAGGVETLYEPLLGTMPTSINFKWFPDNSSLSQESGNELLIGWVNQAGTPQYTSLNITSRGQGAAECPYLLSGPVYAAITAKKSANIDELSLATLAGPLLFFANQK